jgi:hypothetical protein
MGVEVPASHPVGLWATLKSYFPTFQSQSRVDPNAELANESDVTQLSKLAIFYILFL